MRCDIRSGHVNLRPAVRDYVEERLHRSLGRIQDRISHVMIHIDDVNGPKGGAENAVTPRPTSFARGSSWLTL